MREIKLTVRGDTVHASRDRAGVQGEANATALVVSFDESWDGYAKKITFWDALEQNPVVRMLTADLLVDITSDTRTYRTTIPGEPLALDGECLLVIDGYKDGVRARSMSLQLAVEAAPVAEDAGEPSDPTPTQAEQLQVQIEAIIGDIQKVADGAERAEKAAEIAESYAVHQPVVGENGNWYQWDGEAYVDTGLSALGKDGAPGKDGRDGNDGKDGKDGKDADTESIEVGLSLRSQGVSGEIEMTSPGWKRIALLRRGINGVASISCTDSVARSSHSVLLGYSSRVDLFSGKYLGTSNLDERSDPEGCPHIWQMSNNWWGANKDTVPHKRLAYVDKVRIAYPVSWDEVDTSGMTEEEVFEYSHPINTYLDIHVAASPDFDWTKSSAHVYFNILGHMDGHRVEPITEEISCQTDPETGYIVGHFNGVLCQAHEFQLVDKSAMRVEEPSRLDKLSVGKLWHHRDVEYVLNSGDRLPGDGDWHRLKALDVRTTAESYAVLPVRENMLANLRNENFSNASRGNGYKPHLNGLFEFSGAESITSGTYVSFLNQLTKTADSTPFALSAPIVLKKGVQYLVRDCWLHVMTVDEYREAKRTGAEFKATLTNYYGLAGNRVDPATVEIPVDYENDRVVVAASLYFAGGKNYTGRCWYPQLSRADVGVVETDPFPADPDAVETRVKPYTSRATVYSGEDCLPPVGVEHAVELQVWSDDDPDISGTATVEVAVDATDEVVAKAKAEAKAEIAASEKYELIEAITTTEEVSEIRRTLKPDGTAYALKKLILGLYVPVAAGNSPVRVADTEAGSICYLASMIRSTAETYAKAFLDVSGGLSLGATQSATGKNNPSGLDFISPSMFKQMSVVSGVRIYANTVGVVFPVGTKIDIYGVRA